MSSFRNRTKSVINIKTCFKYIGRHHLAKLIHFNGKLVLCIFQMTYLLVTNLLSQIHRRIINDYWRAKHGPR